VKLFRYDALDAGQTFQSVILCEDEDVTTIQDLFPQDLLAEQNLWLGGSQSAGYGHTKIIIDLKPLNDWNEIGVPVENRENNEILSLTLLSDTLLRNEWGQPVADPMLIKQAVEEVLNISLPEPSHIFAGSTLIGGFNRKWGLPLPQLPALAAGSVMVFEGIEMNESQIKQLEAYGIGERREDGFGRLAVNWLQDEEFTVTLPSSSTSSLPPLNRRFASFG
jgi:CRISPR-associated protein Csx10